MFKQRSLLATATLWAIYTAVVVVALVSLVVVVARTQVGHDDKGDCIRSGKLWYPEGYDNGVSGCVTFDQAVKLRSTEPKSK